MNFDTIFRILTSSPRVSIFQKGSIHPVSGTQLKPGWALMFSVKQFTILNLSFASWIRTRRFPIMRIRIHVTDIKKMFYLSLISLVVILTSRFVIIVLLLLPSAWRSSGSSSPASCASGPTSRGVTCTAWCRRTTWSSITWCCPPRRGAPSPTSPHPATTPSRMSS